MLSIFSRGAAHAAPPYSQGIAANAFCFLTCVRVAPCRCSLYLAYSYIINIRSIQILHMKRAPTSQVGQTGLLLLSSSLSSPSSPSPSSSCVLHILQGSFLGHPFVYFVRFVVCLVLRLLVLHSFGPSMVQSFICKRSSLCVHSVTHLVLQAFHPLFEQFFNCDILQRKRKRP